MNKFIYSKKAVAVFLGPALIIYLAVVIAPIFISAFYGLNAYDGMGTMEFIGLANYKELLSDEVFILSIINSLKLAAATLFIQLPIALILALILAQGVRFENFYRTIYFIPVVISSMVIGQLWMKIFNGDYGLLNTFLKSIGLEKYALIWLGDEKTAFWAVVAPSVWQYIGYHMLIMYAGIKTIPKEMYEAAVIDGANWFQTVTKLQFHF